MKNLNQIILEELQKAGMISADTTLAEVAGDRFEPGGEKRVAKKEWSRGQRKKNLTAFKTKASTVYVPKVVELLRGLEEKYGEEEVNVERYVSEFINDFNDLFDEYFTKRRYGYTGEIALGSLSGIPDEEVPAEEAPAEEEPSAPEDDAPEEEGGDALEEEELLPGSLPPVDDPTSRTGATLEEAGSRSERAAGSGAAASDGASTGGGSSELKQAYSDIVRIRRQVWKELTNYRIEKYLKVGPRREFMKTFSQLFDDIQELYTELIQKFPNVDPTPGPDPEEETGTVDDSGHVPLFKYAQAKEPVVDPETGEEKMKRKQPLSSKLAKAGLPKHAINTVMRNIKAQLQANDIQFTESTIKRIETLLTERLLLSERRLEWGEEHQDKVDALAKAHDLKPGEAKKIDKKLRHHLKGFESKDKKGQPKAIAMNKDGDVRLYKDPNAEKEAALHAETGEGKPAEPEAAAKEEPATKGPPEKWVTQGGTQEEWDALDNKEKFVFLKMDPKKQSKFFKMSSEQRLDMYNQMKAGGPTKRSKGDAETAAVQAADREKAAERGIEPESGTIKVSTLNHQLKTINPPIDDATRNNTMNVVRKHLAPYLKAAGIKLSEQQVKIIRDRLLQELKTRDLLK